MLQVYGEDKMMYSTAVFWMLLFVVPCICLLPEYVLRAYRDIFIPSLEVIVRRRERKGQILPSMHMELEELGELSGSAHTGYAFSQGESTDSITQAEVIRRYDTNIEKPAGD